MQLTTIILHIHTPAESAKKVNSQLVGSSWVRCLAHGHLENQLGGARDRTNKINNKDEAGRGPNPTPPLTSQHRLRMHAYLFKMCKSLHIVIVYFSLQGNICLE